MTCRLKCKNSCEKLKSVASQVEFGQLLHKTMLDWYFRQAKEKVWLGTAPNTRAEQFYRKAGWTEVGKHGTKEIKFEMTNTDWTTIQNR
jgi:hypothetical protein